MHFQSITYHARNFFLKMRCWNDRDPVLLTVAGGTRFKASFPAARLATYMRVTKLCFVNIWITRKTKACHCAQPVPSFLSLFFFWGGEFWGLNSWHCTHQADTYVTGLNPSTLLLSSPLSCTHKQPLVQDWASLIQISRLFNLIWVSSDSQNTPERSRTTLVSAPVWESGQSSPGSNSSSEVTNKLWQRSNQKPLTLEQ